MKTARPGCLALPCFALLLSVAACKAKGEDSPAVEPAPEPPVTAPAPTPAPAPAPVAPAPVTTSPASEAEIALAKAFVERFLTAIESNDASSWPAMHTEAHKSALIANNAVEKSYEAWSKGTLTAAKFIREADLAVTKTGNRFTLRFVGVKVPTDPEAEYTMTVAIEGGEMRISEK